MAKCYENCETWMDLLNKDNSTDASKVLCNHTQSIKSTFTMKELSSIPEFDSSATNRDSQSDLASSHIHKSVAQSESSSDSGISDCDSSNCSSQSNSFIQSKDVPSHVFSYIYQALYWSTQGKDKLIPSCTTPLPETPTSISDADHIQILVTGSLHLVGGVLRVLDVDLSQ